MQRTLDDRIELLSQRFRTFGLEEANEYSPLYREICLGVAEDPDILALAAVARRGQPAPNLLLGAVHYLLLNGSDHPLRRFYGSLTGTPSASDAAYPEFRSFCLEHRSELTALLETRLVQTNEVGRSLCLFPAFATAAERGGGGPIALVEIGASAGLNLLFDRFGYSYGADVHPGVIDSPVQLKTEVVGKGEPPVQTVPAVGCRTGIDLNPVDVRDEDQALWLRALVWPEHRERMRLLGAAIELARQDPPPLIAGDAVELLPEVLLNVPPELTLCVFHSFVLHQVPAEARQRLFDYLLVLGRTRPLYFVSMAGVAGTRAEIALMEPRGDDWHTTLLARSHAHGHWLEWLSF
jgi:hypothetical protein